MSLMEPPLPTTPQYDSLRVSPTDVCPFFFQAIAPLLENNHPPPDLCEFFCKVRRCWSGAVLAGPPASACAR